MAYMCSQLIFIIYLWQAVSTRGEVLDLGTDFVYFLRNSDIKSTLAIRQDTLRHHGFLTKMFQRPTQYKDLSNMRGGLNIPEHVKSAEIHYRVIKKLPDCSEARLVQALLSLHRSIPLLISEDIVSRVGKKLTRKLRRFVKYQSSDINGHPTCDVEYRILHHRNIYAAIDPTLRELTELRAVIKVLDPSRNGGRGRRRLNKKGPDMLTTPTLEPTSDASDISLSWHLSWTLLSMTWCSDVAVTCNDMKMTCIAWRHVKKFGGRFKRKCVYFGERFKKTKTAIPVTNSVKTIWARSSVLTYCSLCMFLDLVSFFMNFQILNVKSISSFIAASFAALLMLSNYVNLGNSGNGSRSSVPHCPPSLPTITPTFTTSFICRMLNEWSS